MALARTQVMTIEQFEAYALHPENAERRLEYYDEEIIEVVSQGKSSELAGWFVYYLRAHLLQSGRDARITIADGGYKVRGHAYIPDVALVSLDKQPEPSEAAYNPNTPDLVVEVVSPSDRMDKLMVKVMNFVSVGTTVWVAYPNLYQVHVYAPDSAVQQLGLDDTLSGGAAVPGFELALSQLFAPFMTNEND